MTIAQILKTAKEKLANNNLTNPHLEAELLLAFVLAKSREFLFTHPETKLSLQQKFKYQRLLKQRVKNIPLAYLVGQKDFYGKSFEVSKNTLIPRPETELIIDEVLKLSQKIAIKNLVDIGTGTGCIIITLAQMIKEANFIGADISRKALKVAIKNSRKHGVDKKINFYQSDLLKNISSKLLTGPTVITANLPYLTLKQIKNSPSIQAEPILALDGDEDGLKYYRQLFGEIKLIKPLNQPWFILCEIDESQTLPISQLIKKYFAHSNIEIKKDLQGLDRLIIIALK